MEKYIQRQPKFRCCNKKNVYVSYLFWVKHLFFIIFEIAASRVRGPYGCITSRSKCKCVGEKKNLSNTFFYIAPPQNARGGFRGSATTPKERKYNNFFQQIRIYLLSYTCVFRLSPCGSWWRKSWLYSDALQNSLIRFLSVCCGWNDERHNYWGTALITFSDISNRK